MLFNIDSSDGSITNLNVFNSNAFSDSLQALETFAESSTASVESSEAFTESFTAIGESSEASAESSTAIVKNSEAFTVSARRGLETLSFLSQPTMHGPPIYQEGESSSETTVSYMRNVLPLPQKSQVVAPLPALTGIVHAQRGNVSLEGYSKADNAQTHAVLQFKLNISKKRADLLLKDEHFTKSLTETGVSVNKITEFNTTGKIADEYATNIPGAIIQGVVLSNYFRSFKKEWLPICEEYCEYLVTKQAASPRILNLQMEIKQEIAKPITGDINEVGFYANFKKKGEFLQDDHVLPSEVRFSIIALTYAVRGLVTSDEWINNSTFSIRTFEKVNQTRSVPAAVVRRRSYKECPEFNRAMVENFFQTIENDYVLMELCKKGSATEGLTYIRRSLLLLFYQLEFINNLWTESEILMPAKCSLPVYEATVGLHRLSKRCSDLFQKSEELKGTAATFDQQIQLSINNVKEHAIEVLAYIKQTCPEYVPSIRRYFQAGIQKSITNLDTEISLAKHLLPDLLNLLETCKKSLEQFKEQSGDNHLEKMENISLERLDLAAQARQFHNSGARGKLTLLEKGTDLKKTQTLPKTGNSPETEIINQLNDWFKEMRDEYLKSLVKKGVEEHKDFRHIEPRLAAQLQKKALKDIQIICKKIKEEVTVAFEKGSRQDVSKDKVEPKLVLCAEQHLVSVILNMFEKEIDLTGKPLKDLLSMYVSFFIDTEFTKCLENK